jgi:phenylacetate-coenzyme A ligase PaaK-like adenylate-forming protein
VAAAVSGPETFRPFDLVGDAERIRELQDELVRTTMRRVGERHPFYRDRMARDGIAPGDIDGVTALQGFPLTEKSDLVAEPDRFRLDPDPERPEEYVLWDVAYTSGTSTGRPTPMYQTAHDYRALAFAQRRMAEIRGMGDRERIVNLYPITALPHGAWLRCNQAAAVIGASVTAGMSGRAVGGFPIVRGTDEVVGLTVDANPTVLWGVPSYVRRVLQEVASAGKRLPSLRIVAVSGEPCGPGMRASIGELAERTGALEDFFVSDSLGATELQCGLVECEPGAGFHNPAPELFHLAAVDDRGRHTADGDEGRLVLTHLDRRGTVLVRFVLGDRVVFTDAPCPRCGRGGGRVVSHRGRSGRFAKVRGNLIDLGALADAVAGVPAVVEHQVVIRRPENDPLGLDELVVRIVTIAGAESSPVEADVRRAVEKAARMRPIVETVSIDVIWSGGPDMKPARVVDERESR